MRFVCSVCQQEFASPLRTLDLRLQRLSFKEKGDAVQTTVHLDFVQTLRNHSSRAPQLCARATSIY